MIDYGILISAITKASIPVIQKRLERNVVVISLLKKFNLSPEHPPKEFSAVYAYALVEYGVGKSKIFLDFFSNEYVKEIFKRSFEEQDTAYFLKEISELMDWHKLGKEFTSKDIDPRKELAKFSVVFNKIIDLTRYPTEVKFDHKIENIRGVLQDIILKLEKIESFENLLGELTEKKTPKNIKNEKIKLCLETSSPLDLSFDEIQNLFIKSGIKTECNLIDNDFSGNTETLSEIEKSDVYILILNKSFESFEGYQNNLDYALGLKKQCFIYFNTNAFSHSDFLQFRDKENLTIRECDNFSFLPDKIKTDVTEWLLVLYRELTALLLNEDAEEDQNKIIQEVSRLKSTTEFIMPEGTNLDLLFYNVKNWFKAIGYFQEKWELRKKEYIETVINIPRRRRGRFDRVLVKCIEGEIQLQHVKNIMDRINILGVHEGWLVTDRRISEAARKQANQLGVECYTFDELIDLDANFDGYLEWLENEILSKQIDKLYLPLACTKEEFDENNSNELIGESRYGEKEGYVDGYIDRWLEDPSKKHISILGEFGTGKTWVSLHYAWSILQNYKNAKSKGLVRPRIPLFIPLRDYAKAFSVETLLSDFFFRKHEIDIPNYAVFEELNRMGKLLLMFDGFDEMAAKVDRQQMINNFWELAKVVVPGAKAILTCRTEHFPEAREGRNLLNAELKASTSNLSGEPPQFEVLNLVKFNKEQIKKLLSYKINEETLKQVLDNKDLMSLISRPLMTDFVLDALPEINAGKPIDISRVYLYAVKTKMLRDIKSERTFTSLADKLFFLSELSFEMVLTDEMSVNYKDFPQQLKRVFGSKVQKQKDLDHWHYDMLGQTILIRNSEGDYSPFHRSLTEFFTAYKFAAELGALDDDFTEIARSQSDIDYSKDAIDYQWKEYFSRGENQEFETKKPLRNFLKVENESLIHSFGSKPITSAIIELFLNMISKEKLQSTLLNIIDENRGANFSEIKYLLSNSITLLNKLDLNILSGKDLSNCILINSNLRRANLEGTNFNGSDMTNANLISSILKNASFVNTNLEGVFIKQFGWISGVNNEQYSVKFTYPYKALKNKINENEIFINCERNNTSIWDTIINSVYIVDGKITDNKYLEILCIEGKTILFELETGKIQKKGDLQSNFLLWENVNIDKTIGLEDGNHLLIRAKGAVSSKKIKPDFKVITGLKNNFNL
ncbi:NACHT domain-containing protein [Peribacillus frigoritolerans]|uniref:NACHT domain-containing protein n=1 Tax=Peribacillus frigoritolerans TaxID=450367 RepID=UPI00203B1EE6|nr:pentapeptide repeat-containing protein [Peribacillus frigoritolerans]MCM3167934.1 pentapeptide repeat-containing protein [Peribacillus frigoritolerans]